MMAAEPVLIVSVDVATDRFESEPILLAEAWELLPIWPARIGQATKLVFVPVRFMQLLPAVVRRRDRPWLRRKKGRRLQL